MRNHLWQNQEAKLPLSNNVIEILGIIKPTMCLKAEKFQSCRISGLSTPTHTSYKNTFHLKSYKDDFILSFDKSGCTNVKNVLNVSERPLSVPPSTVLFEAGGVLFWQDALNPSRSPEKHNKNAKVWSSHGSFKVSPWVVLSRCQKTPTWVKLARIWNIIWICFDSTENAKLQTEVGQRSSILGETVTRRENGSASSFHQLWHFWRRWSQNFSRGEEVWERIPILGVWASWDWKMVCRLLVFNAGNNNSLKWTVPSCERHGRSQGVFVISSNWKNLQQSSLDFSALNRFGQGLFAVHQLTG